MAEDFQACHDPLPEKTTCRCGQKALPQKGTFLRQGRMGQWHSSRLKVFQKLFAGGFPTDGMVTWYPGSSL
jgi:hypothetical protein